MVAYPTFGAWFWRVAGNALRRRSVVRGNFVGDVLKNPFRASRVPSIVARHVIQWRDPVLLRRAIPELGTRYSYPHRRQEPSPV